MLQASELNPGTQRQAQGVEAVADPYHIRRLKQPGELTLKSLDLRAPDIAAAVDHPQGGLAELVGVWLDNSAQIKKRVLLHFIDAKKSA